MCQKENSHLFLIYLNINVLQVCVGLLHKIPMKYMEVCGCNGEKSSRKVVWIVFQGTVLFITYIVSSV